MALKKSETGEGKKKKKKKVTKTAAPIYVLPDDLPPVPVLKEALICQVDDSRRWAKSGLASSALPRFAKAAAWLCRKDKCHFCAQKQEPVAVEKVFDFHPEYPLCQCLAPLRKMAFDYVENWDSVEGKKHILALVDAGKVALDTPVYQYFCQCGDGPVVVDYRTIAFGLRKHQKHSRRRLCNKCYQNATTKRAQLNNAMVLEAQRAKQGPGARINKIKQTKNQGPQIPLLPPLNAILSAPNSVELKHDAPEKEAPTHR